MRRHGLVVLLLALSATIAAAGESVRERWDSVRAMKGWITALAESSQPTRIPAPVDRIVVVSGSDERLVYEARPRDFALGEPVVSRDGSRLAFRKTEQVGDRVHERLYIVNGDGTGLQSVSEFESSQVALKGAIIGGASAAWSHDNRALVTSGRVQHHAVRAQRSLVLIDVQGGTLVQLVELAARGRGSFELAITSQAWAPDNRRIVYTNEEGHAIVLDTVTGARLDIGPGRRAAWAPDGRVIAVQEPATPGDAREGDYVLIRPDPPHQRTKLLSNARRWFSASRLGYLGPAVWMPDSRFVVVFHQERNESVPYVLDSMTGQVEKLPPRFVSESWGGKP